MDSLKGVFSKGLTTLNVKTSSFMEESKCKTYISTLEKEIRELKYQAGDAMYDAWKNQTDNQEKINELLQSVADKETMIQKQNEMIKELAEQQHQILGSRQLQSQQQPAASVQPAAGVVYCAKCGTQNQGSYKFCVKCGEPLGA